MSLPKEIERERQTFKYFFARNQKIRFANAQYKTFAVRRALNEGERRGTQSVRGRQDMLRVCEETLLV